MGYLDDLSKNPNLTEMMKQYVECKKRHIDCILLYRLGDFYEMFFEDANIASNILDIALTSKNCGLEERAPMCGIPYHSAENYISKLTKEGYKVAIAEQLENPAEAKGIVKRDVIKIITPGTNIEDSKKENTYLASIYSVNNIISLSYVDILEGDIYSSLIEKDFLTEELSRIKPTEIVFSDIELRNNLLDFLNDYNVYTNEDFDDSYTNISVLNKYFSSKYLNSLEFDENDLIKKGISILLNYILYTQKKVTLNINSINIYSIEKYMMMDSFTRESLELTRRMYSNEKNGSLYSVLDNTKTAMGSRLLKRYIEEPLINKEEIEERLNYVEELYNDALLRDNISSILKNVYDIERLCGKIAFEKITPKELIWLKKSIASLPYLKHIIETSESKYIKNYVKDLDTLNDIFELIENSILEDASMIITEGNIIKPSYNKDLEKYIKTLNNINEDILNLEIKQQEFFKNKNIKIRKNGVDGYYLEITKTALASIDLPIEYKKVKDLSNASRFIFPELKKLEVDILTASDKSKLLEYEIFTNIKDEIIRNISRIKRVSKILSNIDVYLSLAEIAFKNNYVKPKLNNVGILEIHNGRHPVVETVLEDFIDNDIYMDSSNSIHLITGPNMAGKSTYMRQVVLITLMAQMGSFVPCTDANISICDKIFTRIGASDNLAKGDSTFMVEMKEVSQILNNATSRSLIILDEVGRGTSTFDGISLAWAIIEYIEENIKCNTLFATHYFELTKLSDKYKDIKNFTVSIEENNDEIKFLRKIIPGCANKSYGIYVAKFAKIPNKVIDRAKNILKELEDGKDNNLEDYSDSQHFIEKSDSNLEDEIINLNLMNMNPMEVFNYLYNLQNKLKNNKK